MESLEDNYVKKHIHDDVDWLVGQGEDPLLATKKARLRIFGDPPQAYGTGVGALIEGKKLGVFQRHCPSVQPVE